MDVELAQQIASGDATAGPFLVSYVGPKLAGYADRIAADLTPADRDEVVERALQAVVKHIDRYDSAKGSLATWARPHFRFALLDWRRSHPGGSPVRLDALPDFPDPAPDEPNPDTDRRAAAISSLLPDLTSTDQQIIQLRLSERLTFPQIANLLIDESDPPPERLKRFETACRKRFTRAVAKLRKLALDHPDLQDLG
jgi:RNA polymerase sigma factor (sigma-70 family)